jgi:hypothetical protein
MLTHRLKDTANSADAALSSNPQLVEYTADNLQPESPSNVVLLTLGSRLPDGSQRAWLGPSGGSTAGVMGKNFQFFIDWLATDSITTNGRAKFYNNQLLTFSFAWKPTSIMSQ